MTVARQELGPGRILVCCYGLFVVAAGSRAIVQLATHPARALLGYVLSAVAALMYLAGLVLIARFDRLRSALVWARALTIVELTGVVTVGTASLLQPSLFPEPTVWSAYGKGYGFVPIVLPLLAFWWLMRSEDCLGNPVLQERDDERIESVGAFDRETVASGQDC